MQLMSNRKIAYILTLVCYREVECWEQYHTEHKKLDLCIYREMLFEIRTKLDFYLPFTKYMRMGKDEWIAHEKAHAAGTGLYAWLCLLRRKYS